MYHTQEHRGRLLTSPICCINKNSWLGEGYYFWKEEVDAIHWGHNSKKKTASFDIYVSDIDCENVLDTVFNEDHYTFWVKQIEKAAKYITIKTGKKPTLKEINVYFKEKANWSDITGIMFQDLPFSDDLFVKDFNYRKRIQLVAYNSEIIHNFAFHLKMKCN